MSSDTAVESLASHLEHDGWGALSSFFMETSGDGLATIEAVLSRMGGGRSDRVAQLFEGYLRRMIALANQCLRGPKGADPAEDVVQSVLVSFFGKHQGDVLQAGSDDFLWPVLLRGTIRHCHKRVKRWQYRAGHGLAATSLDARKPDDSSCGIDPADSEPPPDDYIAFLDFLRSFRKQLTDRQREVVELRLAGCTQQEIADKLKLGLATVERDLASIRETLSKVMAT